MRSLLISRLELTGQSLVLSSYRALVQRAINISREFEIASRARERQMRASESLALTSQADAAFLIRLAQMELADMIGIRGSPKERMSQLRRTVELIRSASFAKERGAAGAEIAEVMV